MCGLSHDGNAPVSKHFVAARPVCPDSDGLCPQPSQLSEDHTPHVLACLLVYKGPGLHWCRLVRLRKKFVSSPAERSVCGATLLYSLQKHTAC